MLRKLLHTIVGDPNQKLLDSLQPDVEEIGELGRQFAGYDDDELRERSVDLKTRYEAGETLEELLPEAFALVREAAERTIGLRHYDVQIMGGILLHRGNVVEMRTGEGKTLVATLPLYLNALTGKGAHLVTVNDYLAKRDGGWMGKVFHALGLSVGCIGPQRFSALFDPNYLDPAAELEDERLVHWRPCERREAYRADITYGTSSEFGFDYLRDNMAKSKEDLVQPETLNYAIIDEVDNVLIDEARTPLIISGPADQSGKDYARFAQYVRGLQRNTAEEEEEPNGHYDIDEKSRSISLTEMGIAEIEERIPEVNVEAGDNLYEPRFYHLTYYLDNALKAEYMFKRDHEYVVQDGQVIIVDSSTGRLMPGRRYSDGLHEAIEAKEGVRIKRETTTVATITVQNYFRLYDKLAGMTGTAVTDAEEFDEVYDLEVVPLPTNVQYIVDNGEMGLEEMEEKVNGARKTYYARPEEPDQPVFFKRLDYQDQVYANEEAKDKAIVREIKRVHDTGRPVLVGTTSVEHSEVIHKMLNKADIDHYVLNAKQHDSEALVVAQAGRKGAVTISTNMAGRGTDILLGGNPEGLAAEVLEEELFDQDDLTRLAERLVQSGEEEARSYVRQRSELTEDLVDALLETQREFDAALEGIDEYGEASYLARSLQEPYGVDYNDAEFIVRLVSRGNLAEARSTVEETGVDVALVDEIARRREEYRHYRVSKRNPRDAAGFLAKKLFERNYDGRSALIRTVLGGDDKEAQTIVDTIPGLERDLIDRLRELRDKTKEERREVWKLGGLHVVGSERHESRRIDNQLRGRAARQGDPGSSRFFLSLDDELMRRFGGERLRRFMDSLSDLEEEDVPLEMGIVDRIIESAQERIEGYNFDIRKNIVEYDDVMSKQREAIYAERRAILMGEDLDLDEKIRDAFATSLRELIHNYIEDYAGYVQGEIDRAIADFSTDATDTINVKGVMFRLRGLLPGITELDSTELSHLSGRELSERLLRLAHENVERGENLYQLLQATRRFIPLVPAVPNLAAYMKGRRSGHLQTRENVRRDFIEEVKSLFESFLADYVEDDRREAIWQEASSDLNEAFDHFAVEGVSRSELDKQQERFRSEVDETLRRLLIDSLQALDADRLFHALQDRVQTEQERWRDRIGEEQYQEFQKVLLVSKIDAEWRDYLTAMDDLRREVNLEAFAQRDPKVEYKRRSYQMFADMRSNIDEAVVDSFFRELPRRQEFIQRQEALEAYEERMIDAGYQLKQREQGKGYEVRRDVAKVGRNDPCPCGSGKKYKHCHGHPRRQRARRNRSRAGSRR